MNKTFKSFFIFFIFFTSIELHACLFQRLKSTFLLRDMKGFIFVAKEVGPDVISVESHPHIVEMVTAMYQTHVTSLERSVVKFIDLFPQFAGVSESQAEAISLSFGFTWRPSTKRTAAGRLYQGEGTLPTFSKLMRARQEMNDRLPPDEKTPLSFYSVDKELTPLAFLEGLAQNLSIPIARKGHMYYHDITVHSTAIFLPPELWRLVQNQLKMLFAFRDYLISQDAHLAKKIGLSSPNSPLWEKLSQNIDFGSGNAFLSLSGFYTSIMRMTEEMVSPFEYVARALNLLIYYHQTYGEINEQVWRHFNHFFEKNPSFEENEFVTSHESEKFWRRRVQQRIKLIARSR